MKTIGNPDRFAFEIGGYQDSDGIGRHVDIWAGGMRLCAEDRNVHVGQFANDLADEIKRCYHIGRFAKYLNHLTPADMAIFVCSTREEDSPNYDLENDTIYPYYRFLDLGPTTDHLIAFLFRDSRKAILAYLFWREARASFRFIELDFDEIVSVSTDTVNFLLDT